MQLAFNNANLLSIDYHHHFLGIGLSTQTYCGKMRFSAIVDPQMFANTEELTTFLEDIVNEIHLLAKAYGVQQAVEESNTEICEVVNQTGKY